jgi:hypothetical protein
MIAAKRICVSVLGAGLALAWMCVHANAQMMTGTIVATTSGCSSRYVIGTQAGYVLAEWFGGYDPSRGDTIYGNFNTYGMQTFLIAGTSTQAWVDDFMLSRDSVLRKLVEHSCTIR